MKAKEIREELERVMGGDEWLADVTLDYLEDMIFKSLSRFQVWGTDDCPKCSGGRITLYCMNNKCVSCENDEQYGSKETSE